MPEELQGRSNLWPIAPLVSLAVIRSTQANTQDRLGSGQLLWKDIVLTLRLQNDHTSLVVILKSLGTERLRKIGGELLHELDRNWLIRRGENFRIGRHNAMLRNDKRSATPGQGT